MLTVTLPDEDIEHRLADLRGRVDLVHWDLSAPLPPDVAQRVTAVEVPHYFSRPGAFDVLNTLPHLRYVWLPSAGYEHAVGHLPAGVTLCNGRGVQSTGTAELTLALTLAAQRGIPDAVRAMDRGKWENPFGPALADRHVVLVGYGSVAQAIAARLEPFEVTITPVAHHARDEDGVRVHALEDLPGLLPGADIVILAVPLNAGTDQLFDAGLLARMKDGALLVNVARGRVVDTDALLAELRAHRLRAALDVTDPEPLPTDHPLWHAPGILITAHQGGNTDATYPRIAGLVRRQIQHLLAGEDPENIVVRG
ncbi:MAG: 2-hydroxyacid dehydrogenase [Pauljensenia sp.]